MIPREALFDATPAAPPTPLTPALPAHTFLPDPDGAPNPVAVPDPDDDAAPQHSRRQDGWSAATQRRFLKAIAEGHGVEAACRRVGLSTASAYAFRRTAKGAGFALGWRAAALVAREAIAETLLVRALEGQVDTYVRADGTIVTRHRHDNRLAVSLLARLDRQVESAPDADVKAARLVAQDFHAYLDLVARDEGPARAGLFLARRAGGLLAGTDADGDAGAAGADLAPIFALATADRLLRTGHATAGEVPVADLNPAARAEWTAEQWQRAEAAGLLRLALPVTDDAPADDPAPDDPSSDAIHHITGAADRDTARPPQLPQHSRPTLAGPPAGIAAADPADTPRDVDDEDLVWWSAEDACWYTCFPPPDGFDGQEDGLPGDREYGRTLTAEEEAAMGPGPDRHDDATLAAMARTRAPYFAEIARARRTPWLPPILARLLPPHDTNAPHHDDPQPRHAAHLTEPAQPAPPIAAVGEPHRNDVQSHHHSRPKTPAEPATPIAGADTPHRNDAQLHHPSHPNAPAEPATPIASDGAPYCNAVRPRHPAPAAAPAEPALPITDAGAPPRPPWRADHAALTAVALGG